MIFKKVNSDGEQPCLQCAGINYTCHFNELMIAFMNKKKKGKDGSSRYKMKFDCMDCGISTTRYFSDKYTVMETYEVN